MNQFAIAHRIERREESKSHGIIMPARKPPPIFGPRLKDPDEPVDLSKPLDLSAKSKKKTLTVDAVEVGPRVTYHPALSHVQPAHAYRNTGKNECKLPPLGATKYPIQRGLAYVQPRQVRHTLHGGPTKERQSNDEDIRTSGEFSKDELQTMRNYAAMHQRVRAEAANIAAMQAQATQAAQAAVNTAIARRGLAIQTSKSQVIQNSAEGRRISSTRRLLQEASTESAKSEIRRKRTHSNLLASVNPVRRQISPTELPSYVSKNLAQLTAHVDNQAKRDHLSAYRMTHLPSSVSSRSFTYPLVSGTQIQTGGKKSTTQNSLSVPESHVTLHNHSAKVSHGNRTSNGHAKQKEINRHIARSKETDFASQVRAREQAFIKKQQELLLIRQRQLTTDVNNNRKVRAYVQNEKERHSKLQDLYSHYSNYANVQAEHGLGKTQAHDKTRRSNPNSEYIRLMAAYNASLLAQEQQQDLGNSSPPMPVLLPQTLLVRDSIPLPNMNGSSARASHKSEMQPTSNAHISRKRPSIDSTDDLIPQKRKLNSSSAQGSKSLDNMKDSTALRDLSEVHRRIISQQMSGTPLEKHYNTQTALIHSRKNLSNSSVRDCLFFAEMSRREREDMKLLSKYVQVSNKQKVNPLRNASDVDPLPQSKRTPASREQEMTTCDKLDTILFQAISGKRSEPHVGKSSQMTVPRNVLEPSVVAPSNVKSSTKSEVVNDSSTVSTSISPTVGPSSSPLAANRHIDRLPSYEDAISSKAKVEMELTPDVMSSMAKRLVCSSQEWLKKFLMKEKEDKSDMIMKVLSDKPTQWPHTQVSITQEQAQSSRDCTESLAHVSQQSVPNDQLIQEEQQSETKGSTPIPHTTSTTGGDAEVAAPSECVVSCDAWSSRNEPELPRVGRSLSHDPRKKVLAALSPDVPPADGSKAESSGPVTTRLVEHRESVPCTKKDISDDSADPERESIPEVTKADATENDLMQADAASLGREERALQRAILRFNELEKQVPLKSNQTASKGRRPLLKTGTSVQKRKRRKLSKFRRRIRTQRNRVLASTGSNVNLTGRKRGRPRLSSLPPGIDLADVRRGRFQDFVPTILESRTRNAGSGRERNYRSIHDARNIRYELEIERERIKVLERRRRYQNGNGTSSSTGETDKEMADDEEFEPPIKRPTRGRPRNRPDSQHGGGKTDRPMRGTCKDVIANLHTSNGDNAIIQSHPFRVVLDENSSNCIKMKFFNIRNVNSDDGHAATPQPRRRGRPRKVPVARTTKAKYVGPPDSPEPPKLELMSQCVDKENACDYEDYVQDPDFDVTDTEQMSLPYLHAPVIRPEPPQEMKKLVINKKLGETVLHRAATIGNLDIISYCVDYRVIDVNTRDNAGYTALHESCVQGHIGVAQYLLSHGADVNASAADGTRPIHDAVDNDRVEVVRLLLAYGADPLLSTFSGRRTTKLALTRSSEMTTLVFGYLRDVNGDRTKLEDFPQNPIDFQWSFNGSCSLFDEECHSATDIFADVPGPDEPRPTSDSVRDQCGIFFEVSEHPMLPSFNLRLEDQDRFRNWLLVKHVADRLSVPHDALLETHPELQPVSLPVEQFQQFVQESQVSKSSFARAHGDVTSDLEIKGEEVTLIALDDNLRKLLEIEVECLT